MVLGLLLLAVTLAAYQPAWNGKLLWDDDINITMRELRSPDGLARIWTHPGATQQYYPLVHTVFWLEYHLWGASTLGYHLLNILLHVFSALLLVTILRRLGMPVEAAWLAGGIFALHPVMVESVAWITQLKNTLSGFFFMSAALAYLTYTEAVKRRWYVLAWGLFLLGLLSKTAIVPFPLAMLAVIWWKRGRILLKRDIMPLLPFVAAGVFFGLITLYVEHFFVGARGREFSISFIERCLIAGRAFWFYLGKVFFPINLIFIYPRWSVSATVWWQYLFPAGALAAAGVLWTMRKRWRAPLAVFLYFSAMLLPVIGFFNVYAFRFSFVADHLLYLAATGPIAMCACVVDKAVGLTGCRRVLRPAASVALLLTLGMLSWKQSGMYVDAETLYRTTIRKNADCWMAYNNLGILMANTGRTDEAISHYRKAVEINPDFEKAYCNLGNALSRTGKIDEAIVQYGKALHLDSNYVAAHINLGTILLQTGRMDEVMAHYLKALELNPNHAETHFNLGLLLAKMGRTDEAVAHFQKALEIDPNNSDVHYNLGLLLAKMGRTDEAVAHYRKTLEFNPHHAETHNNLGILLAQTGRIDGAIAHCRKALECNPNHAEANNNLGILLAQTGRTNEAIAHYRKALEIRPDAIDPLQNLAFTLVQKGQWSEGTLVLQNALASAKYTGDEARAKTIEHLLAKLNEIANDSQAPLKRSHNNE
ncbi:MAG: tetratricopeptide repeat protein [Chitinispirillaceae bacterium]|nr:tetratricopeptide repeat protein [Chitinispirillaceae bacterium]